MATISYLEPYSGLFQLGELIKHQRRAFTTNMNSQALLLNRPLSSACTSEQHRSPSLDPDDLPPFLGEKHHFSPESTGSFNDISIDGDSLLTPKFALPDSSAAYHSFNSDEGNSAKDMIQGIDFGEDRDVGATGLGLTGDVYFMDPPSQFSRIWDIGSSNPVGSFQEESRRAICDGFHQASYHDIPYFRSTFTRSAAENFMASRRGSSGDQQFTSEDRYAHHGHGEAFSEQGLPTSINPTLLQDHTSHWDGLMHVEHKETTDFNLHQPGYYLPQNSGMHFPTQLGPLSSRPHSWNGAKPSSAAGLQDRQIFPCNETVSRGSWDQRLNGDDLPLPSIRPPLRYLESQSYPEQAYTNTFPMTVEKQKSAASAPAETVLRTRSPPAASSLNTTIRPSEQSSRPQADTKAKSSQIR